MRLTGHAYVHKTSLGASVYETHKGVGNFGLEIARFTAVPGKMTAEEAGQYADLFLAALEEQRTYWKGGDPYPEDWPEWLRKADILWCRVEIKDGDVHWYEGTWRDGVWERGTWYSGSWHEGEWRKGLWIQGIWGHGRWLDGQWLDGTFRDGLWVDGVWHQGDFQCGKWMGGEWKGGIWHSGNWAGGEWGSRMGIHGPIRAAQVELAGDTLRLWEGQWANTALGSSKDRYGWYTEKFLLWLQVEHPDSLPQVEAAVKSLFSQPELVVPTSTTTYYPLSREE